MAGQDPLPDGMGPLEDPGSFPPAVLDAAGSAAAMARLQEFAALLVREGDVRGLIGPRELPRLWSRHIVNSMAVSGFVPEGASVGDVGSGAGFPGLVLAITRPDVTATLIESMERRTAWLRDVTRWLELPNVEIVTARAEALHGARTFDVVTARAVAALDRLAGWTLPLVGPGGSLVALKGERAREELLAAESALAEFGGGHARVEEVPSPLDGTLTRVVVVRREGRARRHSPEAPPLREDGQNRRKALGVDGRQV